MKMFENYNRLIDIEFLKDDYSSFIPPKIIKCPLSGRKPNIEIAATIYDGGTGSDCEIRIHNFYMQDLQENQIIRVSAGYEYNKRIAFVGTANPVYIESPGPEQTTLFKCTTIDTNGMLFKAFQKEVVIKKGDTLMSALTQIGNLLKYSVLAGKDVSTTQLDSDFYMNGLAKDSVLELRNRYPKLVLCFDSQNQNLIARFEDEKMAAPIEIKALKAPPQKAGSTTTIQTLFDPAIVPGSVIDVRSSLFAVKYLSAADVDKTQYTVNSVHFEFSTVGNKNSMTIQGV